MNEDCKARKKCFSSNPTHLSKVLDTVLPSPLLAPVLLPVIKCSLATRDPSKVVSTTASSQSLTASVGFLNPLIIVALDHCGLVAPIILATSEVKGLARGGDRFDILWIATHPKLISVVNQQFEHSLFSVIVTHAIPASMTNTRTAGFSAKRPATAFPAVPPVLD